MARTTAIQIPNSPSSSGSSSSSYVGSGSPGSANSPTTTNSPASVSSSDSWAQHHRRRQSLLSSSFTKVEHTSFDLGVRDGATRVITYVKTSQGFDWNQDIFLPSSSDITVHNGINQPESVHEIFLSEKEEGWLPSS